MYVTVPGKRTICCKVIKGTSRYSTKRIAISNKFKEDSVLAYVLDSRQVQWHSVAFSGIHGVYCALFEGYASEHSSNQARDCRTV